MPTVLGRNSEFFVEIINMPASDAIYQTSASWDDAKDLFNEQTRTYSGVLPRMHYWSDQEARWNSDGSADTEGVKKRFLYDTRFFNVHVSGSTSFTFAVDGYLHVEDYIVKTDAPWGIIGPRISAHEIGGEELHACFVASGAHIGSLANPATDPCGSGSITEDEDLRFQTSLGAPEDPVTTLFGDTFAVPILPETLAFWTVMEQYSWDNQINRGENYVDKVTGSSLPDPVALVIDWEDYHDNWQVSGYDDLYSNDPRFEFNSSEHADITFARNLGTMLDARYQILMENIPYVIDAKNISVFEANFTNTHRLSTFTHAPTLSSTGRKKGDTVMYPGGIPEATLIHELNDIGAEVFQASTIDMHVFGSWFSSGQSPAGQQDNPTLDPVSNANIALTIAQTVGVIKLMMAMGSELIAANNGASNVRHQYLSAAVAYDEMQQYADYIKLGTNYIPPFDVNKAPLFDGPITRKQWMTPYYGKESDGTVIPDGVFINCRIWGEKMLFVGLKVNAKGTETTSSTHTIRAPTMQEVTITASPEGTVTIL